MHGTKACDFFQWFDEVGNDKQKEVICGMTRKIQDLKARIQLLGCLLGIAIMFIVGLGVSYVCK